ncbi:hypothetical protein ARMGADRAFT_621223 [Armillaria gallica]|uniref:Uncharacterized protein n=1 Tax=Armillaria gallica TaxID=47427 RepID=A0A2H3CXH4_ARMGA|nr:hypothetical protein ARMGADRAFT_621223 [Armillaria gallica]
MEPSDMTSNRWHRDRRFDSSVTQRPGTTEPSKESFIVLFLAKLLVICHYYLVRIDS